MKTLAISLTLASMLVASVATAEHEPGVPGIIAVVPLFNPASNEGAVSFLRFTSLNDMDTTIAIVGVDDTGNESETVYLTLGPLQSMQLTAQELEYGLWRTEGAMGDGAGKWFLLIAATDLVYTMNMLRTYGGPIVNMVDVITPRAAGLLERTTRFLSQESQPRRTP